MHGITDKDVKGAPSPKEAAEQAARLRRRRARRRPQRRLRPRLHRGGAWATGSAFEPGTLPRHAGDRPRGLSRTPSRTSSATSPGFFGIELTPEPPRPAGRRGDRQPPALVRERPAGSDLDAPRVDRRARSAPIAPAATPTKLLEAARREARVSKSLFNLVQKKTVRRLVLDEGIRIDGRGLTDIRPITVEVGLVPRAHGSGLFTRGETQALTVATLGSSSDVQRIDTISPETEKRYLHHYNFPPYSTGENKMMRGPSRRDIGHGHLAERALVPVLPDHDEFPYVIRLVSASA